MRSGRERYIETSSRGNPKLSSGDVLELRSPHMEPILKAAVRKLPPPLTSRPTSRPPPTTTESSRHCRQSSTPGHFTLSSKAVHKQHLYYYVIVQQKDPNLFSL